MNFEKSFPTFVIWLEYLKKHAFAEVFDKNNSYPFLLGCYPLLFQYAKNWTYLSFYDLFAPLLFVIVLTYVLLAFVNLILRDGMKTSVIISFFLIMFFSYGHIYESIKTARIFNHEITHGILIGVCFCVFAVFIFFIMLLSNTRAYFERYMKIFSVLLLLLISFNLGQAVLSDIGELIADVNNDNIVVSNTEKNRAENNVRPDIYYIILDSYSGDLALKEFFDFDNGEFVAWLKNNGFKLPRRSWSNDCQTAQSLSSSLNMDYINKLFDLNGLKDSTDRSLYKRLIGKNALTRFLKTRGYTIVKFIYGYVITDSFEADKSLTLVLALPAAAAHAQTGFANVIDHIHMAVPDQAKGVEWYHAHFGGEPMAEGPDRVMFGNVKGSCFRRTPRRSRPMPASCS